jgi:PhnB protein
MTVAPYLSFNGQCREAMEFYREVFEGTGLSLMRYGDQPVEGMEAMADRIMHSDLKIDGALLMAADSPMGRDQGPGNVSVMHDPVDVTSGKAKFDRLAEGGEVTMPFQKTFWSPGFGMVRDRFGIHWLFSTQVSPT